MNQYRADKFNQLIDLLDRADALQQTLLDGSDDGETSECYQFHCELNNIADRFTDIANKEGIDIG